ncbi:hypothetical protein IGJ53_003023 [Enterococcus sp. DIV1283b]
MEKVEKKYDIMIDHNRLIELEFKSNQASKE